MLAIALMDRKNKGRRGSWVKVNKQITLFGLAILIIMIGGAYSWQLSGQTGAAKSSTGRPSSTAVQWSVQVNKVDPGDVNLEPSFEIAIYESLLQELNKTKQFKQVIRAGDRNATDVSDLLILKTSVQKYAAGSETRRAVTTVGGATKLTVHSQLCTRDGQIILERTVSGNVRFMGSNLKATHNLARNVAKSIKQSPLPAPSQPVSLPSV
jgi:hypothetical protein